MARIINQSDKVRVLEIIQSRKGPNEAIGSEHFGLNGGTVRGIVQQLRREGYPICTETGKGYYYASTSKEVLDTINYIQALQQGLQVTLKALNNTYLEYKTQELQEGISYE